MGATAMTNWVVRTRPAPPCDPPYDDERHPDSWLVSGQPQLDLPLPAAATPSGLAPSKSVPPTFAPTGMTTTPTATSPAKAAATRFLRTCLEILNGYRPVAHFRALASPPEAAALVQAMAHALRRLEQARRQSTLPSDRRLRPGLVRMCEPRPGIAEISLVVGNGAQAWALAFRLERHHGRWLCTVAQLL